jgi:hypothetical protein
MVAQHWAHVKAVEESSPALAAFIQDLRMIKTRREEGVSDVKAKKVHPPIVSL